nr:hypothetical protein [Tanacetum cinerariifolium]
MDGLHLSFEHLLKIQTYYRSRIASERCKLDSLEVKVAWWLSALSKEAASSSPSVLRTWSNWICCHKRRFFCVLSAVINEVFVLI